MVAERGIAFEVALEGRGLALSWQGGKAVMRALNDSTFFDVEDGREVRFSDDGTGSYWFLGLSGPRARRIERSRPLHADRSRRE